MAQRKLGFGYVVPILSGTVSISGGVQPPPNIRQRPHCVSLSPSQEACTLHYRGLCAYSRNSTSARSLSSRRENRHRLHNSVILAGSQSGSLDSPSELGAVTLQPVASHSCDPTDPSHKPAQVSTVNARYPSGAVSLSGPTRSCDRIPRQISHDTRTPRLVVAGDAKARHPQRCPGCKYLVSNRRPDERKDMPLRCVLHLRMPASRGSSVSRPVSLLLGLHTAPLNHRCCQVFANPDMVLVHAAWPPVWMRSATSTQTPRHRNRRSERPESVTGYGPTEWAAFRPGSLWFLVRWSCHFGSASVRLWSSFRRFSVTSFRAFPVIAATGRACSPLHCRDRGSRQSRTRLGMGKRRLSSRCTQLSRQYPRDAAKWTLRTWYSARCEYRWTLQTAPR